MANSQPLLKTSSFRSVLDSPPRGPLPGRTPGGHPARVSSPSARGHTWLPGPQRQQPAARLSQVEGGLSVRSSRVISGAARGPARAAGRRRRTDAAGSVASFGPPPRGGVWKLRLDPAPPSPGQNLQRCSSGQRSLISQAGSVSRGLLLLCSPLLH